MKIYGPFHALNNPLVMADLTTNVANNVFQVYKAATDASAQRFTNEALLRGEPVPELPGSPFRRLLSHTGLVSPNVSASPEEMSTELLALQKQRGENLKSLSELGTLRKDVGPGPFGEGSPLAMEANRLSGGTGIDLSQLTPTERIAQQKAQQSTPEAQIDLAKRKKQAELDVANSPENLMTALAQNRVKTRQDASIREGVALDEKGRELLMENSPAINQAKAQQAAAEAAVRTHATDIQHQADLDNTPIADLATNKTAGGVYVNRDTLKMATGKGDEPKTKREADINSNYVFVPNKDRQSLSEAVAMVRSIDDTLNAIDTTDVFPDTSGMNSAAALAARSEASVKNRVKRNNDPDVQRFYRLNTLTVEYFHNLQKRYPNAKELEIPVVPDPGGIRNHLSITDSKQAAKRTLEDMRQRILDGFTYSSGVGSLESGGGYESTLPSIESIEP